MTRSGYVYLMASQPNGTIYLGVTSDIARRAYQHRFGLVEGFTKKHGCTRLVWFEQFDDIQDARTRERQMKSWKRAWKLRLIEEANPAWRDLFDDLSG
ncbi:MAG: GIY-YIG nuclease family protein [Sphingomonadaceae bacterium]|nr:GIY-YIG nuclease family protein [Sphingomonadaceae bacterium]NBU78222.1 GIY-YIG nuclease family protein [Sphingomonadaceae bacterium]NCA00916.1 GIY-YIG nuclease family protein [Sphingomonadaceae bacterium]